MANKGKLESKIVVPSGGWTATFNDGGPDATITFVADNTYYWSSAGNDSDDLAAKLQALLNAAGNLSETYTVTVSAGESGTGKATIAATGNFTCTWVSTDLRDLFGFAGNISSTTSATGANVAHGLWLPDCNPTLPFGVSDDGWDENDAVNTMAPTGAIVSTLYNTRTATSLQWAMVANNRARTADEVTTNESFQTFYKQSLMGTKDWALPGGPVRYHPDADTDGTYTEYAVVLDRTRRPEKTTPGYDSWYRVSLPRLVKVP